MGALGFGETNGFRKRGLENVDRTLGLGELHCASRDNMRAVGMLAEMIDCLLKPLEKRHEAVLRNFASENLKSLRGFVAWVRCFS